MRIYGLRMAFGFLAVMAYAAASADVPIDLIGQWGGKACAVAVMGDIAYVGIGQQLVVFDVSDPASPVVLGETPALGDSIYDIALQGSFAYLACSLAGLVVVDISDLTRPVPVGAFDMLDIACDVTVKGSIAYVADGHMGIQVIDVSDPKEPVRITQCCGSVVCPAVAVETVGTYAYVGLCGYPFFYWFCDEPLRIFDMSDPANPEWVSSVPLTGPVSDIIIRGSYAYVLSAGLVVLDISDPSEPHQVGEYPIPVHTQRLAICGDYAYVAEWENVGEVALEVIDISDPEHPTSLATECASGPSVGVAATDATVFLASRLDGVLVYDVTIPSVPSRICQIHTCLFAIGVTTSGRYAYVSVHGALEIVDLVHPRSPKEVGWCDLDDDWYYLQAVEVAGPYAYVISSKGLRVVDVSVPEKPRPLGVWYSPSGIADGAVSGDYAYLLSRLGASSTQLVVIDVSDPLRPREVAQHECDSTTWHLAVSGTLLLLPDDRGVTVFDLSDPLTPVPIGRCDLSPQPAGEMVIAGPFVYVLGSGCLHVVDLSDPAWPVWCGSCPVASGTRRCDVAGDYAYVASESLGTFEIVDVADPCEPTAVGQYSIGEPDVLTDIAIAGNSLIVSREATYPNLDGGGVLVFGAGYPLQGAVELLDFLPEPSSEAVDFEARQDGACIWRATLPLDDLGGFTVPYVMPGSYDFGVNGSHWLRASLDAVVEGPTTLPAVALINGDAMRDNTIDLLDLNVVLLNLERLAPNQADLDGSGVVDALDLGIVLRNFGVSGDP
jgi:hypothetical protein